MRNIIASFALAFIGFGFASCEDVPDKKITIKENVPTVINPADYISKTEGIEASKRLESPKPIDDENSMIVVVKDEEYGTNYFVEWDCNKRAQRWTAYQLYKANLARNTSRSGDDAWHEEEQIPVAYRSVYEDYHRSGFDRGHMCPSADRLCSKNMNKQTFSYCNMHPQVNGLNAGMWAKMEDKVRAWATDASFCDTLYVVKGGTISDNQIWSYKTKDNTAEGGGVIIPKYFFMAILVRKNDSYKAMGFWIEHPEGKMTYSSSDKDAKNMKNYAVTIDQLETFTGIDFFYNLDPQIQDAVESDISLKDWKLQ